MAWLDHEEQPLDVVIGPIETYEDKLFGYKAAFEAVRAVKDMEWSKRLAVTRRCACAATWLPVPDALQGRERRHRSDLNAYDVIYYAGDCNAGRRPSPSTCRTTSRCAREGHRGRLQLKNAMARQVRPDHGCRSPPS